MQLASWEIFAHLDGIIFRPALEGKMKVKAPGQTQRASVKKTARKGAADAAGFRQAMKSGQAPPPGRATGVAPIPAVNALLGLQEIEPDENKAQAGVQYGENLLDQLEAIRRGLLLGTIPVARLDHLAKSISQKKADTEDLHLKGILEEIELRVRVELAKLERNV